MSILFQAITASRKTSTTNPGYIDLLICTKVQLYCHTRYCYAQVQSSRSTFKLDLTLLFLIYEINSRFFELQPVAHEILVCVFNRFQGLIKIWVSTKSGQLFKASSTGNMNNISSSKGVMIMSSKTSSRFETHRSHHDACMVRKAF